MRHIGRRRQQRGTMLAMAFVFVLFNVFVITGLHYRLSSAALIEKKLARSQEIAAAPVKVLARALHDLQQGEVIDGTSRTYLVGRGKNQETFTVRFEEMQDRWQLTVTPPANLPAAEQLPRNMQWPTGK